MDTKTEDAVESAVKTYQGLSNAYRLSKGYSRLIKEYLEPEEWIALGARQSRLVSLSPSMLLATNKKLMFCSPSFWRLYTGHVIFGVSKIQFIPYNTIISISFTRGRYLSSINIKTLGDGTIGVNGLKIKEAKLLLNFMENVVERISGSLS